MEEKEKYGYIYKITDLIDNVIYVGKRSKPYFDEKYWGSGKIIKLRIKSHGRENMKREILEWCYSSEELCEREKFWIKELNAQKRGIGCNISYGGDGEPRPYDPEVGAKISNSLKGIKRTPEQCKHYSEAAKKRIYTKEMFLKGVETKRKKRESPDYVKKPSKLKGRKLTEEHKKKIGIGSSIALKGKSKSESHKQHLREANLGKKVPKEVIEKRSKTFHERGIKPWNTGLKMNEEFGKKVSEVALSKHAKWMNNGIEQKKVPEIEFQNYLDKGWTFGKFKTNNVWICKDNKTLYVKKEEVQSYLENGWIRGRVKNA